MSKITLSQESVMTALDLVWFCIISVCVLHLKQFQENINRVFDFFLSFQQIIVKASCVPYFCWRSFKIIFYFRILPLLNHLKKDGYEFWTDGMTILNSHELNQSERQRWSQTLLFQSQKDYSDWKGNLLLFKLQSTCINRLNSGIFWSFDLIK